MSKTQQLGCLRSDLTFLCWQICNVEKIPLDRDQDNGEERVGQVKQGFYRHENLENWWKIITRPGKFLKVRQIVSNCASFSQSHIFLLSLLKPKFIITCNIEVYYSLHVIILPWLLLRRLENSCYTPEECHVTFVLGPGRNMKKS